jgi:hypothetical protein
MRELTGVLDCRVGRPSSFVVQVALRSEPELLSCRRQRKAHGFAAAVASIGR